MPLRSRFSGHTNRNEGLSQSKLDRVSKTDVPIRKLLITVLSLTQAPSVHSFQQSLLLFLKISFHLRVSTRTFRVICAIVSARCLQHMTYEAHQYVPKSPGGAGLWVTALLTHNKAGHTCTCWQANHDSQLMLAFALSPLPLEGSLHSIARLGAVPQGMASGKKIQIFLREQSFGRFIE